MFHKLPQDRSEASVQVDEVGVLGFRYRSIMARVRRWEPAVILKFQDTRVAQVLLEQALEYLTSMGVKRIGYLMKHPIDAPDYAAEHLDLFEKTGFVRARPDSVDMVHGS